MAPLAVLAKLPDRGRRYQELHDALDGISYKMLTETLRRADRDGLVTRRLDPGRVETATRLAVLPDERPNSVEPPGSPPVSNLRADFLSHPATRATPPICVRGESA
jgi:HxlR-like helix-turn-helix